MFRELNAFAHLVVLPVCAIFAVTQQSPTVSADQIWNDLAAGNHRFIIGKTAPHDLLAQRKALTKTNIRELQY